MRGRAQLALGICALGLLRKPTPGIVRMAPKPAQHIEGTPTLMVLCTPRAGCCPHPLDPPDSQKKKEL